MNIIDRTARTRYSEILRQFASGRTTNKAYEKQFWQACKSSDDKLINVIYWWIWFAYDDIQTHKITGRHSLTKANRRNVARCILFLQNDAEYYDPLPPPGWGSIILSILTLGLWKDSNYAARRQHEEHVWPFATAEDLDAARQHPKLLCGNRC